MAVETYEIEEVAEELPQESEEASRLVAALGLSGQEEMRKAAEEGDAERIPYRKMTEQEVAVFGTLCPAQTPVEQYSEGPIPLRVLQVIAHAKGLFDSLEVWHPKGIDRDPVLVGVKGNTWSGTKYILARWGEELDEWPALLKRAVQTYRELTVDRLRTIANSVERGIKEMADGYTVDEFLQRHGDPSFHWS